MESSMTIDTHEHRANVMGVYFMVRRNSLLIIAGALAVAVYLTYVFVAFDVPGLIAKSHPMRATLLATDAVAHKVHVTKFFRGKTKTVVAVEGERTATYQTSPEWVRISDDATFVDLGGGYHVEIKNRLLSAGSATLWVSCNRFTRRRSESGRFALPRRWPG